MASLFPLATLYDSHRVDVAGTKAEVNEADIAIVCVPTLEADDGSASLREVDDVFQWLQTPWIVIRSTIPPGTTERLRVRSGRPVVFWPEYTGEWTHPGPWERTVEGWPFVLLGGRPDDTRPLMPWLVRTFGAERTYRQSEASLVELCKYMENTWLASQVLFANEFRLIAEAIGVDYWELRELWALDPRVSKQHTGAFEDDPGFGGKCLPKDVAAIIAASTAAGYAPPLLKSFVTFNNTLRAKRSDELS